MYYEKPLPFYMTYPYVDMYEQEKVLDMEMQRMKSYYPKNAARVQKCVEEACDRIEYEGSIMYDEYPDRFMMNQMCEHIYNQVKDENARIEMMELEETRREKRNILKFRRPEIREDLRREVFPDEEGTIPREIEEERREEEFLPTMPEERREDEDMREHREKEEEVSENLKTQEVSDMALRELVQVLFFNELYRRRCRRKRCRRYF